MHFSLSTSVDAAYLSRRSHSQSGLRLDNRIPACSYLASYDYGLVDAAGVCGSVEQHEGTVFYRKSVCPSMPNSVHLRPTTSPLGSAKNSDRSC